MKNVSSTNKTDVCLTILHLTGVNSMSIFLFNVGQRLYNYKCDVYLIMLHDFKIVFDTSTIIPACNEILQWILLK